MNNFLLRFVFIFTGFFGFQVSFAAEINIFPNSTYNYTSNAMAETSILMASKAPGVVVGELVLRPMIDLVHYSATSCFNALSYPCSYAWQNFKNFSINLNDALSFPGAEAKTNTNDIGNDMNMFTGLFASVFSVSSPQVAKDACIYLPPTVEAKNNFFHEMVIQGNNIEIKFNDLLAEVTRKQESLHRFQFRFQLENENHAKEFLPGTGNKGTECSFICACLCRVSICNRNIQDFCAKRALKMARQFSNMRWLIKRTNQFSL